MKTHVFRLHHGQDLRAEIEKFVSDRHIRAAVVLSAVGNLKRAVLRMAGGKEIKTLEEIFEIVSLVGTVEPGNSHLHATIVDARGQVTGGHLRAGSLVSTTAEIVLGELEDVAFKREFDAATGYDELVVNNS